MDKDFEVLVIGAGQAGLALGKALKEQGISFVLLEAGQEIGSRWRQHYDSLVLFTPRRYSALPGLPLQGEQDGYATKDEFAEYLEQYAKRFDLPIVVNERIERLYKDGQYFVAETNGMTYRAKQAVIATGNTLLSIPLFASGYTGLSMHSSKYKNPAQIPSGRVLVVGGGNSGAQIAVELSTTHEVDIALSELPKTIPPSIFGKSFYWWNTVFGLDLIPTDSFLGRMLKRDMDFVVGTDLLQSLKGGSIRRQAAVTDAKGKEVTFANGEVYEYDAVIWATGFRPDYAWIDIPGALKHTRGVSEVPGLYFVGLRNQISIFSGNIYGTKINTPHIMKHLTRGT